MISPTPPDTATTEWAVMCQDGSIDPESAHDPDDPDDAADAASWLDDDRGKFCGPHRVVSRSVGPWVEQGTASDE